MTATTHLPKGTLQKTLQNPTNFALKPPNEAKRLESLRKRPFHLLKKSSVLPATLRKFYKKRLPTLGEKRTFFATLARDVLSFVTFCDTSRLKTRIPLICDTSRARTPKIGRRPPKVAQNAGILEKTTNSPPN